MPKLDSIAEIRAGATLRGRDATRPDPKGAYHFIRIGDITSDGRIKDKDLPLIQPRDPINEDLILRSGDVLVPARGTRTAAASYRLDLPKAIVGAQFFIVRPKATVLPEFLAWFLRSETACQHFAGRRKGSYVQLIQRHDVAELAIPIPPLEEQRKIVQLADLIEKQERLCKRIAELKAQLLNARLERRAKESNKQPKKH